MGLVRNKKKAKSVISWAIAAVTGSLSFDDVLNVLVNLIVVCALILSFSVGVFATISEERHGPEPSVRLARF